MDSSELIPEGWQSHQNSWHFQRRLYRRLGIRLEYGEYAKLVRHLREREVEPTNQKKWFFVPFRTYRLMIKAYGCRPVTVVPHWRYVRGEDDVWRKRSKSAAAPTPGPGPQCLPVPHTAQ